MGVRKDKERTLAKELYLTGKHTQKEIAEMVEVSEKTIVVWAEVGKWPAMLAARLSTTGQVVANMIEIHKARTTEILANIQGGGDTAKYGDEMLKMSLAIEKLQGSTSLTTYIQVLSDFMAFIGNRDHKFRGQLADYQAEFLNLKNGTNV